MARKASTTSAKESTASEVVSASSFTVNAPSGLLNVREKPTMVSNILAQLKTGEKVKIDVNAKTPDGWKAVEGGGFVMAEFLR